LSALPLVSRVVRGAVVAGFAPVVGCAVGADSLVLSSALLAGLAPRLSVLAAFGPAGAGACASSSVSLVQSLACAGAPVSWWAGGGPRVPVVGRLAARSVALCRLVAGSAGSAGGAPFVGFVAGACPAALVPARSSRRCFAGSGSGSWASLALAAGRGCAVSIFWCGAGAPVLPAWPGGAWVPCSAGWLAGSWSWVPTVAAPLF